MKKLVVTTLAAAVAALCATASAGLTYPFYVTVDPINRQASGAIGSARQGGGANDEISCQVQSGQFNPTDLWVECKAVSSAGTLDCRDSSPNLISIAQAIHGDSYISFSGVGCGGNCCVLTALSVFTGSFFYPTQP